MILPVAQSNNGLNKIQLLFLFNFKRFFILHFDLHELRHEKFHIWFVEGKYKISNILHWQRRFPSIFCGFLEIKSHIFFLIWIEWINISNRFVLSFQKICFLLFFRLKFFKPYYNELKIIKFWKKNILFRIITQDSCINRYLNLEDIVHLKILDVYKGRGVGGGCFWSTESEKLH